ncbi:MAG: SUMF1/EgtB/PvdO family nonheme iron enzyme [Planctomycetes bacterium]|nr:SUMF1/EgtB/PvdO family nonheme iron enzyme [Planctomycetota bacterium]
MLEEFIVALSANLATQFLTSTGRKDSDGIKTSLDEAFAEGIRSFSNSFNDEDVDKDYLQKSLNCEEVQSLFVEIVKDPSLSEDTKRIENVLSNSGIDTETINGFNVKTATTYFLEGFTRKAESSVKRIQFMELQVMKGILKRLTVEKPDLDFLKRKYFNYIKEKYSHLSFKGLSEGKLISFSLKDIYTKLTLTKEIFRDKTEYLKKKELAEKAEFIERLKEDPVKISDILDSKYSVITGDPGSGKSTLLKYIALAFIDRKENERLEISENRELLPILFPIAAYAEGCKKEGFSNMSLNEFIPLYFKSQGLPNLTPLFENALKCNNALVLLDGLDEVSDESERKKMVSDISNFIGYDNFSDNKYLVTCRTASYTMTSRFEQIKDTDFTHYIIHPFDIDEIEVFFSKWYLRYEIEINRRMEAADVEAEKNLTRMMAVVKNDRNIFNIATNPLMLTILALIEHEGGELPKDRSDLYAKCLRILSGSWENLRSLYESEKRGFKLGNKNITEDFIVYYLGPIAFDMHVKAQPDIDYETLKEELTKKFDLRNKDLLLSKEQATDFVQIMKERSGILQEVSTGTYGFIHLTFKEYLAARNLTDLCDNIIEELGGNLFKPEWKEVLFLTVTSLKRKAASNFIKAIFKKKQDNFKNLILAGECALDTSIDNIDEDLYDNMITEMKKVIDEDVPVKNRVEVGEILGWLGDTRELKEFIPVAGGRYKLENGPVDIKPFEISKYPVTNSWFEEFVKTGGYKNREYWSEEGKKWLDYNKAEHPKFWNDRKWNCPNSPVVGVSWYEAYAFTKWLSAVDNDGYKYRLLEEGEWEAAAAGSKGRKYPWGNEWDKNRCNNREIGLNKTSPVGVFKDGNTPDGISDMSGNVWEWTTSDYHSRKPLNDFAFDEDMQKLWNEGKADEYFSKLDEKDRELSVLRGGSWIDDSVDCRCACRGRFVPDFRDSAALVSVVPGLLHFRLLPFYPLFFYLFSFLFLFFCF